MCCAFFALHSSLYYFMGLVVIMLYLYLHGSHSCITQHSRVQCLQVLMLHWERGWIVRCLYC